MVKSLLAATDLSPRSERALRRAASLSRQLSAELSIVHVVDGEKPADVVEEETRKAGELLKRQSEALREAAGTLPAIVIKSGDPFQEIATAAAERQAGLIVMGTHRTRLLRDMLVGTTVERAIRAGHHPVLRVSMDPAERYVRVIVATDMSEASANALVAAKQLGLLDGPDLSVIHAFEAFAKGKMIYAGIEREKIDEHVAHEAAEAKLHLASFLDALGLSDLRYDIRVEEGRAPGLIKNIVKADKADLLVIGTRGSTGAKRLLLGSVAEEVLRSVDCDVLAVPSPLT